MRELKLKKTRRIGEGVIENTKTSISNKSKRSKDWLSVKIEGDHYGHYGNHC